MILRNLHLMLYRKRTSIINLLFFILVFLPLLANAQEQRNLLQKELQEHSLSSWQNIELTGFTAASISEKLQKLPERSKQEIRRKGEAALAYNWPVIPVTAYLEFVRSGDREIMQRYYRQRNKTLKNLVLAELLEGEKKYIDAIVNASWALCEQSSWVLSAHLPSQKAGAGVPDIQEPILDLGAGETSVNLGWVYHLFGTELDKISPLLKKRIFLEIDEKIIQPYVQRNDFWWMAFKENEFVNNWNPWVNYNVVLSTILLGDALNNDLRKKVVKKSMRSVDNFINYYKQDGAADEGPNYWSHAGGKLLEYLELLKNVSKGHIDLGQEQIIQNIGTYIMDVHIVNKFYVNFADSSVRVKPNPALIYRYGLYINKPELMQFGAFVSQNTNFLDHPIIGSLDYSLNNLYIYKQLENTAPLKENKLVSRFDETGVVIGRTSSNGKKGFFFAAKGGHNNESHNHNDVGSFVLYHQGEPLIVDVGVETYTAKTFSKDRYEIWTMQSDYHNLPKINNNSQAFGKEFSAKDESVKETSLGLKFRLDISEAYPKEAYSKKWVRNFELKREQPELIIEDSVEYNKIETPAIHNFMLAAPPKLVKKGKILLRQTDDTKVHFYYPSAKFKFDVEEIVLNDEKLLKDWQQEKLYRLVLTSRNIDKLKEVSSFRILEE